LTIENNSGREMTVKVMKSLSKGSRLFERIYISAYGSQTVTFYESGYYFTKTKATKNGVLIGGIAGLLLAMKYKQSKLVFAALGAGLGGYVGGKIKN
jgi:hypothetical protein